MLLLRTHALRRAVAKWRPAALSTHARRLRIKYHPEESPTARKVIFSGIQPTGIPHLGNYLGALRQWVKLQDEAAVGTKLLFSIVDLHAITVKQDAVELTQRRKELLASLYAVGLNQEKSSIFFQSRVPHHAELMWILSCNASMGYLSRMTQWKVHPVH